MLVDEHNQAGLMFGTVSAVDAATCRIRVRLDDRDGLQTHWLHVPQRNTHDNKHRSLPDLNGHVAVMLAANGVDGVYLGAIYSSAEPPPITDADTEYVRFSDGTVVSLDRKTSRFCLHCSGPVEVFAADTAHVKAGSTITLDAPDIDITGNATVRKTLIVAGGMDIRGSSDGGDGNTASIRGNISVKGNVRVDGDIDAGGTVMDGGGNSNHHSH